MSSLLGKKNKSRSVFSLVQASSSSFVDPIYARNARAFPKEEEDNLILGEGNYVSASSGYDSHSIASPEHLADSRAFKTASLDFRRVRGLGESEKYDSLKHRRISTDEKGRESSRKTSIGYEPKESSRKNSLASLMSSSSPFRMKKQSTSSGPFSEKQSQTSTTILKSLKAKHSFERVDEHAFDRAWLTYLYPYILKLLEWTFVILLIYLGFNAVYIFLLFILYAFQIHSSENARRLALFGKIPTEEFLSMIDKDSFPSWLKTPEMDRVEWINDIISQLWPNLSRYSTHFIKTFIEPELVEMLNELQLKELSGFEIKKVLLGTIPLKIGGCRVFPRGNRSEKDGIILEMEIFYSGDARVQFVVQHIAAEIKNISFRGIARVNLKPLLNTFPLIGGCEVTFMQLPIYNYSMGGIGTFADLPGISTLVKSIVDSQIESRVLWPNKLKIVLPIPETEEAIQKQKSYISRPYGYLHVHVIEAENLVAKDISMVGKGTSDPYAIVVVNGRKVSFQSQYVAKNLNPVWDYKCDFILDGDLIPEDHQCEILVYDYDQGTQDDFMGNAVIDLQSVFLNHEFDNWVQLTNIKKGKVHLKMSFRECSPVLFTTGDYIVYVYIESCLNLQSESGGPLMSSVKCTINDSFVLSQRGKTNTDEGTHHIDDGISFYSTIDEELTIIVSEKRNATKICGDYRLSISDLVHNFDGEITNEALPLNFHSDSKMVVSIKVFSLAD